MAREKGSSNPDQNSDQDNKKDNKGKGGQNPGQKGQQNNQNKGNRSSAELPNPHMADKITKTEINKQETKVIDSEIDLLKSKVNAEVEKKKLIKNLVENGGYTEEQAKAFMRTDFKNSGEKASLNDSEQIQDLINNAVKVALEKAGLKNEPLTSDSIESKEGKLENLKSTSLDTKIVVEKGEEEVEKIISDPENQKTLVGRLKSFAKNHPRLTTFLGGAVYGGIIRKATKAAVYGAFGFNLPAAIAGGAIGGGLWEGIRQIREQARVYQPSEILKQFNNESDDLKKAAMMAQLEELMEEKRLDGSSDEYNSLAKAMSIARSEFQVRLDAKEGKFKGFDDKDKIRYLLNLKKGINNGIEGTAKGKQASDLMKQIKNNFDSKRSWESYKDVFRHQHKVGKVVTSALRGAAYGALGGFIGGFVMDKVADLWHGAGSGSGITEVVTSGGADHGSVVIPDHFVGHGGPKGVTGASRDALHQYLQEYIKDDPSGDIYNRLHDGTGVQRLVYAEDYLKDYMLSHGHTNGQEISFDTSLLHEALEKAGIMDTGVLTDKGVNHIQTLISHKPHFLSEATKQYLLNFQQGTATPDEIRKVIVETGIGDWWGDTWKDAKDAAPTVLWLLAGVGAAEGLNKLPDLAAKKSGQEMMSDYFGKSKSRESKTLENLENALNTSNNVGKTSTVINNVSTTINTRRGGPDPTENNFSKIVDFNKADNGVEKIDNNSIFKENTRSKDGAFLGLNNLEDIIESEAIKNSTKSGRDGAEADEIGKVNNRNKNEKNNSVDNENSDTENENTIENKIDNTDNKLIEIKYYTPKALSDEEKVKVNNVKAGIKKVFNNLADLGVSGKLKINIVRSNNKEVSDFNFKRVNNEKYDGYQVSIPINIDSEFTDKDFENIKNVYLDNKIGQIYRRIQSKVKQPIFYSKDIATTIDKTPVSKENSYRAISNINESLSLLTDEEIDKYFNKSQNILITSSEEKVDAVNKVILPLFVKRDGIYIYDSVMTPAKIAENFKPDTALISEDDNRAEVMKEYGIKEYFYDDVDIATLDDIKNRYPKAKIQPGFSSLKNIDKGKSYAKFLNASKGFLRFPEDIVVRLGNKDDNTEPGVLYLDITKDTEAIRAQLHKGLRKLRKDILLNNNAEDNKEKGNNAKEENNIGLEFNIEEIQNKIDDIANEVDWANAPSLDKKFKNKKGTELYPLEQLLNKDEFSTLISAPPRGKSIDDFIQYTKYRFVSEIRSTMKDLDHLTSKEINHINELVDNYNSLEI